MNTACLVDKVRQFVHEEHLWKPGDHLLLAVSGGPDSVVLFHVLAELAMDDHLRLSIGHIHHGLRDEADEDARFVEQLATAHGIPFFLQRVDVHARVAQTGESIEEAARQLRYAALMEFQHEIHADHLVTGHTADDQAETVLMRLLRGTGTTGLAGIPPQRDTIVRPLLTVWRSEIDAFLREANLPFRTDASNLSTEFTRNRLRLELIPHLEAEYSPKLRVHLQHMADLARQDNIALDEMAQECFLRHARQVAGGLAVTDAPGVPRAIAWRVWRRAIETVSGSLANISYEHIEAIHQMTPGVEVHLPGVHVFQEGVAKIFLRADDITPAESPSIPEQHLPVPGVLHLSW